MEVTLRILTPIWTGGVTGACDGLHETGIIGSLRWWYEAIVRGSRKYACDASEHACGDDGACPVCQLFGCTGTGRSVRFRLDGDPKLLWGDGCRPDTILLPSGRKMRNGRATGWHLGPGLVGSMRLAITHVRRAADCEPLLSTALALAVRHGGLGGRTQNGYGIVAADFPFDIGAISSALDRLHPTGKAAGCTNPQPAPDLRDFFFARVHFCLGLPDWWERYQGKEGNAVPGAARMLRDVRPDFAPRGTNPEYLGRYNRDLWISSGSYPVAPAVKNALRFTYHPPLVPPGTGIENFVYGTIARVCANCYSRLSAPPRGQAGQCRGCSRSFRGRKDFERLTHERLAGKIHASSAYQTERGWEMRLWGWIPRDGFVQHNSITRDTFMESLRERLTNASFWEYVFGPGVVNVSATAQSWLDCADGDGKRFLEALLA